MEVYALPAQGMVVIVTRGRSDSTSNSEDIDFDDIYEMQVTLEESDDIIFFFRDFEYLIQAAQRIENIVEDGGKAYLYQGRYYLVFENTEIEQESYDRLIAILSEFGEASTTTKYMLAEYGKVIVEEDAVSTLCHYFK